MGGTFEMNRIEKQISHIYRIRKGINSIDKYFENTYITVVYNGNMFSSPTFCTFVIKIILFLFSREILHIYPSHSLA